MPPTHRTQAQHVKNSLFLQSKPLFIVNWIEKFHQYKREYEEESQIAIDDQFTISESARKKQQRAYKRVIRLDRKIQIIIDGNRENVEQGEDEKGKLYKIILNRMFLFLRCLF